MSGHTTANHPSKGQQQSRVVIASTLALLIGISLYSVHGSPSAQADQAGCGLGTWDGVECVISGNVNATGTYNFHHSVRLDGTAHINATNAGITLNINGAPGLNLVMQSGSIIEADDVTGITNNPAGPITINVTGNMTMTSATIDTRNTVAGGAGGAISIDVDGDLTVGGTSQIISTNLGNGNAGNITITVGNYPNTPGTGTFDLGADAEIEANANAAGGDIDIEVGRTTNIHGDILSQVLSGSTGTGATQGRDGASIFIKSGCELQQFNGSTISSRGQDAGADLVHIEACDVTISGLVESAGSGHGIPNSPANHCADADRPDKPNNSTGCIEVWARNLVITNTGELNADINEPGTGGTQGQSWIDLMASHNITVTGRTAAGSAFAVHADSNSGSDSTTVNYVTVKAMNLITATGRAFSADMPSAGSGGGQIVVQAGADVSLVTAHLLASGDDVQTGGFGQGGTISVRSFQGSITWTNGTGDVRPTGADTVAPVDVTAPSAASGKRGVINLTYCVAVSTTGSTFPFNGDTATTPAAPVNDCSQNEPTMQSYVECCVSTEACDPLETPTPTPSATPTDSPTPTPSATPTDSPTPTPSATPTDSPTPTPSATPTDSPTPTPSATPTDSPTPSPSPTPADTPTPTPTLPQDTPTPTPTPTLPQDTPTPSPTPTLPDTGGTPTPTPTLPDTSGSLTGTAPPPDTTGQAFLLLLIGSVAGLLFMFLPRKKEEPGPTPITVAKR